NGDLRITTSWQKLPYIKPALVFRFTERFIFPALCMPGGVILIQQLSRPRRIPDIARAPLLFYLPPTGFDDAVLAVEGLAAGGDFVEARPERFSMRVFNDDSVETVREGRVGFLQQLDSVQSGLSEPGDGGFDRFDDPFVGMINAHQETRQPDA